MAAPCPSGHFWEHYSFNGDEAFLGQRAWPVMKEAALFCLDMLVDDGNGHLVTNPSVSPENIFIDDHGMPGQISEGATGDMSLMWDLFSNLIQRSRILGREPEFAAQLAEARSRLLPPKIGHDGVLQEWSKDWRSTDPGHRHLSQLYGVFPGRQFTPAKTPALAEAAKRSLLERDASSYGWSLAWKAASWARSAKEIRPGRGSPNKSLINREINSTKSGWMYPNLFNADPPWVLLNGNMCALAALAEMLMQSHENNIHVLPALPSALPDGSVQGMRARNGFEVSLRWADGKVTECRRSCRSWTPRPNSRNDKGSRYGKRPKRTRSPHFRRADRISYHARNDLPFESAQLIDYATIFTPFRRPTQTLSSVAVRHGLSKKEGSSDGWM